MNGAARYDVHGLTISVEAEAPGLLAALEPVLGAFRSTSVVSEGFSLSVRSGDAARPQGGEGLRLFWEGPLADGTPMAYFTGEGRCRIVSEGCARLELDRAAGRGELEVVPAGRRGDVCQACVIPMLCELQAWRGHHVMHAAALAVQTEDQRRAVLISGPSGTGKTTAALALARGGMDLLSDDTSFLFEAGGELGVWGLRLPLKVHQRTLSLLPWLRELPHWPVAVPAGEWGVDPQGLWPHRPLRAVPRAVVFLDPRREGAHLLERMDRLAAVERLTRENVRATDRRGDGPAGRAFRLLARLADQCGLWRLSAGSDVASLYDALLPLLTDDGAAVVRRGWRHSSGRRRRAAMRRGRRGRGA